MILLRVLTASVLSLSIVGCYCGRNVVMDPCDPCGGMSYQQGCCSSGFWPSWGRIKMFGNPSCSSCGGCGCGGGYQMDSGCGCSGSDGGTCGMPGGTCGSPTGSSSCGCGQTSFSGQAPSIYSTPNLSPQSAPTPSSIPMPTAPEPPPVPGSNSTSMMRSTSGSQPQMVSYEEFQKMPGTIISGPGSSNASSSSVQQSTASAQPFLAPPSPAPSNGVQPRNGTQTQQAAWTATAPF